ncbi:hypothetical protein I302_102359 [Kwoniella bestiolae CBS 10118]|uniref:RRM domain-containing protein n=1 Tax=Kwoniella bestiolae CBS 10118 TaxID=1296100 RepID=A0A1B9GEQ8_9TREE|nr:hypothetical protein I302_01051 [Kwoniella bestiolae CBS 10118]OCF29543.1 hypothetical protein I302_01051 [Kwoniella bestiolae CBS 10118]
MPKRAAPSTNSAPSSKKSKPASTSKTTPKGKKPSAVTTDSPLDTVKQVASDLINTVSEVVDKAGDLILDDGNTPAPVSKVIEENVDVPNLKKKGKAAKAKIVEVAQDAEEGLENAVEEKTGLDVKGTKAKAGKAVKAGKKQVDEVVEASKPLKGKAAKAAAAAQEKAEEAAKEVEKAAQDPKNRMKAEDFMSSAEETVKSVAGKVGEVLGNVVTQFGEASGLSADMGLEVEKGKKVAAKKGKQVKEAAEEKVEEGKKVVGKKGKQAKEAAEEKVEEGKKVAGKKGKQVKEAAEEVVEDTKKTAGKKGQQAKKAAEEVVEEGKKVAGKKGQQAKKAAEETIEEGKKVAGKKGKQATEAATEVVESTKRKAKDATNAVEPTTKKAKAAAQPVIEKGKKAVKVAADAMDIDEDEDEYIHGFSSSDGEGDSDDESDDDDEDRAVAEAGRKVEVSSLPMIAKDDKSVQAKLKKAAKKKDDPKGTLYLGRIPHGFYEDQMKGYFSQFGDVTRLRLARNRKTGASKHYAYIEFSSASVAQIVAETMNNYLLMGHLLKCEVIPEDKVHEKLWIGANKKFRKIPTARVEKQKHEKERTDEEKEKANKKLGKKESARKRKIKEAGIEYDYLGHVGLTSSISLKS